METLAIYSDLKIGRGGFKFFENARVQVANTRGLSVTSSGGLSVARALELLVEVDGAGERFAVLKTLQSECQQSAEAQHAQCVSSCGIEPEKNFDHCDDRHQTLKWMRPVYCNWYAETCVPYKCALLDQAPLYSEACPEGQYW